MKTTFKIIGVLVSSAVLSASLSLAQAKSVPGDAAIPIAELMPLTMRYEADLKLTADQLKALDAYKKEAMPKRLKVQQEILDARSALRMSILENKPQSEREALMKRVVDAEMAHLKARNGCVDNMKAVLSAEQYTQLVQLYLQGLR
jgi:Spy/CpxP family protein refolding chaperone